MLRKSYNRLIQAAMFSYLHVKCCKSRRVECSRWEGFDKHKKIPSLEHGQILCTWVLIAVECAVLKKVANSPNHLFLFTKPKIHTSTNNNLVAAVCANVDNCFLRC